MTKPVEQALSTVSGVEAVNSVSSENTSMVMIQFVQGTNMDSAMIELNSKLDLIKGMFDDGVSSPMMMKINPDMLPVMVASIDVEGMDLKEISEYAENIIIPSFERIGGVASVSANGIVEDRLEIKLNQDKIDELNDRIIKSVDEKLSEAQGKLDESKNQIESAKAQLNAGQNMGIDKIVDAASKVNSGSVQLEMGSSVSGALEKQLADMTDSLIEQRDSLKKIVELREELEDKLSSTEAEIDKTEQALAEAEELFSKTKSELENVSAEILKIDEELKNTQEGSDRYKELMEARGLLEAERESLQQTYDTQSVQLSTLKNSLESLNRVYEGLYDSLSPLDKIMHELGADSTAALKVMLATMDKTLDSSQNALEDLRSQNSELQDAKDVMLKARQELEKGKLSLLSKSTQASVGLYMGEAQLQMAQQELDKSKDEAYKAAGLDGMITEQTISGILTAENFSMPAGYAEGENGDVVVKVGNPFAKQKELEDLVLFHIDGDIGDIRLSDVAEIGVTDNSDEFYAKINGNDSIIFSFQKQSIFSTAQVSDDIQKQIKKLTEENPDLHITALSDQGMYIDIVIGSVMENLLWGSVLAVIILLLFLKSIKPTLTVAFSIPISLVASVVLMYFSGVTLNIISLSGLALGVGMLVDNSIVVIENIYRLRQNGASVASAAVYGAKQVSGAIFASTLTTICVFLPIVFTDGISKQLFTDMGLTIAYSLLSSLVVALTVVPAMSSRLLSEKKTPSESRLFKKFTEKYGELLEFTLRHKAPVLIFAVCLLVVSGVLAVSMGTEFIPSTQTTQMSVAVEMPDDISRDERRQMSDDIAARIMEIEDVETVGAVEGSMMSSQTADTLNYSMYVVLKKDKKNTNAQIANMIEEKTMGLGCEIDVSESSMDLSAMGGSGIQIVVKGDDLDVLQDTASELAEILSGVEGIGEIDDGSEELSDELRVVVDKNEAMRKNLTVAQVFQQLSQKLSEQTEATNVKLDGEDMPIVIVKSDESKLNEDDIESVLLTAKTATGESESVALGDIAKIEYGKSPASIAHDEQSRTHTVSLQIADGYNIGLVSRDIDKVLKGYNPPVGYSIEIAGENETINQSLSDLLMMVLAAVAFIYLIMVAQFQSLMSPFIVIFTIPLAFTGGLLALWMTGFSISIISMLGFLVLSGIVVNNGIVFVDYTNQLRLEGVEKRRALVMTGKARIRPILMTAMTTVFGLFTMALGIGMGADMVQPMAVVTIGGLVYATVLTLFVVPCLYDIFYRKGEMKKTELEPEDNFKLI